MERLREKFQHFMAGRYGMDELGRMIACVILAVMILKLLLPRFLLSFALEMLAFAGILVMYLRAFSKDISRRYQENQMFLRYKSKMKGYFHERQNYRIFKCPGCRQRVRIPRGHGRVSIHCPKCGEDFIKKS